MSSWMIVGVITGFNFMKMPTPIEHLRLKLSLLHSRVLGLFHTLPHQNCRFWVDNLFISMNFLVHALKHKLHMMVEGVRRSRVRDFLE